LKEKKLVNSIPLAERHPESVDGLVVADAFELVGQLGAGVVGVAVFFFVIGYGLALLDGVVKVGLGEGLEGDESEAEGGCRGVEAPVVFVSGFLSAKSGSLEEDYDDKECEKGGKSPLKDEIDIHDVPFAADGSQAWIGAPMKAAAMFLIAGRSGLRGRRTLEEGVPNVGARCKSVVVPWCIDDCRGDRFEEEEEWDE
jgi:hypothetical protein